MAEDPIHLNPVRSRQLRGGDWVVVAEGSAPLVVSEDVAAALVSGTQSLMSPAADSLAPILHEAGFLTSSPPARAPSPPSPPSTHAWKVALAALWATGLTAALIAISMLFTQGIPTGADVMASGHHPAVVAIVAIAIAVATAVPHEIAHVIFGRTFSRPRSAVRLDPRRAVATTRLTHIWVWPLSPRLAAVSAGLVVDLSLLGAALVWRETTGAWVAEVGVAVLVMRIVWQLRVHRNCDGRHIAKMLIDDPTVEAGRRGAATPVNWMWRGLVALGVIAETSLVVVWIGPAVLRVAGIL